MTFDGNIPYLSRELIAATIMQTFNTSSFIVQFLRDVANFSPIINCWVYLHPHKEGLECIERVQITVSMPIFNTPSSFS